MAPRSNPATDLARVLTHPTRRPAFFEVIPPRRRAPADEIQGVASALQRALRGRRVDAINIPEVRNESRSGAQQAKFVPRLDPLAYGRAVDHAFDGSVRLVLNRPTVYEPLPAFLDWAQRALREPRVAGVVLVGGESSQATYPGLGPVRSCRALREALGPGAPPLGGIVIPTRRRAGAADEPERMCDKAEAGMSFFTTQVLCEPDATERLLKDYAASCRRRRVEPRPTLLSVAPVTGARDATFLRWLGVELPSATEARLLADPAQTTQRSVDGAEAVVARLLKQNEREGWGVPLGVNVAHIMKHNVEPAARLLERLEPLLG